jgi:hypothetical protein
MSEVKRRDPWNPKFVMVTGASSGLGRATAAAVIAPVADASRALPLFEREIASAAVSVSGTLRGYFVSEISPNNFPRLPIREDAHMLVFLLGYMDQANLDAAKHVLADLARVLAEEGRPPEILRLEPTPRSLLGSNSAPCLLGARVRLAANEPYP